MARTVLEANWYDHPEYYDAALCSETPREADFIEAACKKYCPFRVRSVFEPACGTGRLVAEMAARGYRATGLDLNGPALDYLRKRLTRRRLKATVLQGDMADFRLHKPIDAAFCMVNSFRHLTTEPAARAHLQCVADALRPGGIYVLGLHLLPPDADEESTERWTDGCNGTKVTVTLRVLSYDRRKRIEQLRACLLVRKGAKTIRLRSDFPFRTYSAAQIRRLFASVPSLELCDVYDFWYDIDEPLRLDNEIADTVFILRKR